MFARSACLTVRDFPSKSRLIGPALAAFIGLLAGFGSLEAHSQDTTTVEVRGLVAEANIRAAVRSENYMIATANPHATRIGAEMLARGGSAVDAMIAAQLVLGLVEPQSSGLGGGAFLVHWDEAAGKMTTLDGRETAPLASGPDLFLDPQGKPLKFFDAVIGGRSVGTPGTVALMAEAHKRYGKLHWAELFQPAIDMAETGFVVSPRLQQSIEGAAESLYRFEPSRRYFLTEEGVPLFAGTIIRNQAYADTLRAIAEGGSQAFYSGPIASDIVETVANAAGNPGLLSLEDLAAYKVVEREPVCVNYRGYQVCGMGPPSSGALTVGQILKLVEPYPLAQLGPDNPQSWRIIGDATRLAFADRDLYMADSDFVKMPKGLLNGQYLAQRAKLLSGERMLGADMVAPGDPPQDHASLFAPHWGPDLPSTSHLSIVDASGNIASMTTTIENGFGSRLIVRGFLLNNELTDFSFVPAVDGVPVANRVEPGKRPRSSMAPTIVLRDGKPVFVVGSPGSSRIIPYVAVALVAHLDWQLDAQAATGLPHLINRYGGYELEKTTAAEGFRDALQAIGYPVEIKEIDSGLAAIAIGDAGLEGGADPRREGVASGG
jgi:gamma-glutamyltranspeptidase / glutathione hydrolase